MTSPFEKHRQHGSTGVMAVGETRTIHCSATGRTLTVVRTSREYVYDFCDALNASMTPEADRNGLAWYVTQNKDLKLGNRKRVRDLHLVSSSGPDRIKREVAAQLTGGN